MSYEIMSKGLTKILEVDSYDLIKMIAWGAFAAFLCGVGFSAICVSAMRESSPACAHLR